MSAFHFGEANLAILRNGLAIVSIYTLHAVPLPQYALYGAVMQVQGVTAEERSRSHLEIAEKVIMEDNKEPAMLGLAFTLLLAVTHHGSPIRLQNFDTEVLMHKAFEMQSEQVQRKKPRAGDQEVSMPCKLLMKLSRSTSLMCSKA